MSLLSSKVHLCVNEKTLENSKINGNINREKVDEICQTLNSKLKIRRWGGCPYNEGFNPPTKSFIEAKVWDIEDAHQLVCFLIILFILSFSK